LGKIVETGCSFFLILLIFFPLFLILLIFNFLMHNCAKLNNFLPSVSSQKNQGPWMTVQTMILPPFPFKPLIVVSGQFCSGLLSFY